MYQRQPHTHLTCGFCLQPKIIRSKPHETKSGQPICGDCLEEWNRCFKAPEDLVDLIRVALFTKHNQPPRKGLYHLERYTK